MVTLQLQVERIGQENTTVEDRRCTNCATQPTNRLECYRSMYMYAVLLWCSIAFVCLFRSVCSCPLLMDLLLKFDNLNNILRAFPYWQRFAVTYSFYFPKLTQISYDLMLRMKLYFNIFAKCVADLNNISKLKPISRKTNCRRFFWRTAYPVNVKNCHLSVCFKFRHL